MRIQPMLALMVTFSLAGSAWAVNSRIKASCYIDPDGKVQGTNPDTLTEIASVSKILTSHWVISKLGPHARFETRVHINQVSQDLYDVHFEGGLDASFNVNRLAIIAGQLNSIGIKHLRNLTFDQNFRYRDAVYSGPQVAGDPEIHVKTKSNITPLLRASVTRLAAVYKKALTSSEVNINEAGMPAELNFKVDNIDFKASSDFQKTAETKSYPSLSVEAFQIIKQMNLHSNNYLANILFERMGGAEAYAQFLKENKSYTSAQVNFQNGSGNPIQDFQGKGRFDNKATCRSIVTIVKDLRDQMIAQNLKFSDVVAVGGVDDWSGKNFYSSDLMDDALIAKTGTSNPSLALAGIASTQKGNIYFAVVVADGRRGTPGITGRGIIRQEVEGLFRQYGGSNEINYSISHFFEVDDKSKLQVSQQPQALQ